MIQSSNMIVKEPEWLSRAFSVEGDPGSPLGAGAEERGSPLGEHWGYWKAELVRRCQQGLSCDA